MTKEAFVGLNGGGLAGKLVKLFSLTHSRRKALILPSEGEIGLTFPHQKMRDWFVGDSSGSENSLHVANFRGPGLELSPPSRSHFR